MIVVQLLIGFIVLVLGAVIALVSWMYYLRRNRLNRLQTSTEIDPLLIGIDLNKPTIVYFTLPTCKPCKLDQEPALVRLKAKREDLQVITVDLMEQPDVANRWGIMSVPATFLIDRTGRPKIVNYEVVHEHKLLEQLTSLASVKP